MIWSAPLFPMAGAFSVERPVPNFPAVFSRCIPVLLIPASCNAYGYFTFTFRACIVLLGFYAGFYSARRLIFPADFRFTFPAGFILPVTKAII